MEDPLTPKKPEKSKNLLKSKTFWVNVAGVVAAIGSGTFGVDLSGHPNIAVSLVSAANIVMRLLTRGPAHIFDDREKE